MTIDRDALRRAIYIVSQRHDWEHTEDREDRTEEIAAEYDALVSAAEAPLNSVRMPILQEDVDDIYGGVAPEGREVIP